MEGKSVSVVNILEVNLVMSELRRGCALRPPACGLGREPSEPLDLSGPYADPSPSGGTTVSAFRVCSGDEFCELLFALAPTAAPDVAAFVGSGRA